MPKKIIGFSKLSREEKIDWLSKKIFDDSNQVRSILDNYLNSNKARIMIISNVYEKLLRI